MKLCLFTIISFSLFADLFAESVKWPLFAFQNGVPFKAVEERVRVLKELGYHGIGSAKPSAGEQLKKRLKLYDEAQLKLFSFYDNKYGNCAKQYCSFSRVLFKRVRGKMEMLTCKFF